MFLEASGDGGERERMGRPGGNSHQISIRWTNHSFHPPTTDRCWLPSGGTLFLHGRNSPRDGLALLFNGKSPESPNCLVNPDSLPKSPRKSSRSLRTSNRRCRATVGRSHRPWPLSTSSVSTSEDTQHPSRHDSFPFPLPPPS